MTDNIINLDAEKNRQRRELNALYSAAGKVEPEKLLPILRDWRAEDPERFTTLIPMICYSANTTPEELTRKRREQKSEREKIKRLSAGEADKVFYRAVAPEDLLPVFKKWKAAEPEKYSTMVAMICYSANINLNDLLQKTCAEN